VYPPAKVHIVLVNLLLVLVSSVRDTGIEGRPKKSIDLILELPTLPLVYMKSVSTEKRSYRASAENIVAKLSLEI